MERLVGVVDNVAVELGEWVQTGTPIATVLALDPIVVRAEDAYKYTDTPIFVKALSFIAGNGSGLVDPGYDYTWFPEIAACAQDAYAQAGIDDRRRMKAVVHEISQRIRTWAPDEGQARICYLAINEVADRLVREISE